jgi:hypothetical protein
MKLASLKDQEDFHAWQLKNSRGVDERCQQAISIMAFPIEYPCVIVWDIREEQNFDVDVRHPNAITDVLRYKYVYIGNFPMKRLKKGTYVYQVFQTSDGCADI